MTKNNMNKKIEVRIPNWVFYFLAVFILIVAIGVGVYAYNPSSSGNPATMGHSLNEIAPPTPCTVGQYLQRAPTTLGWACASPTVPGSCVVPPAFDCVGSNKGLQWSASTGWNCVTFVTSP